MARFTAVPTFSADFQRPTLPTHRRHVLYSGRVQGVGFRYTVKNIAMRHDISGYVRNLADGRVELIVEGRGDEIDQLMADVSSRMNGYIRGIEVATPPATGEFSHFHIRH